MYAADRNGQPLWENGRTKIVRCQCKDEDDLSRRLRYLLNIDGLTNDERAYRLANFRVTPTSEPAVSAIKAVLAKGRGIVTLTGMPGLGKTRLMISAINEMRENGTPSVYTTVTDLLDYLRKAYDPKLEDSMNFDARWDLLTKVDVLALDELDEFNTTPWATERFLRLIDERWRGINERITLIATNASIGALPDKVGSRLRDGRAVIARITGPDVRPYLQ